MLTLTTFGSPQIGSAMLPAGRRLVAAAVTLVVTGGLSTVAALPAAAAASTMHYSPGAPILRSFDLVNWEFAGHSAPCSTSDPTPTTSAAVAPALIRSRRSPVSPGRARSAQRRRTHALADKSPPSEARP